MRVVRRTNPAFWRRRLQGEAILATTEFSISCIPALLIYRRLNEETHEGVDSSFAWESVCSRRDVVNHRIPGFHGALEHSRGHLARVQKPGRSDSDFLRRHAGGGDGKGCLPAHGEMDRSSQR